MHGVRSEFMVFSRVSSSIMVLTCVSVDDVHRLIQDCFFRLVCVGVVWLTTFFYGSCDTEHQCSTCCVRRRISAAACSAV
mmetsp:Transcript_25307/g.66311  ORF Transcript_25307/g.66311 Transcript_25307/m.66311 type:complete len:80 (-) Transcript_25307:32-271(-)